MQHWQPVRIEDERTRYWQIGPLSLWARRAGSEWSLATVCCGDSEDVAVTATVADAPEDAEWQRFEAGEHAPVLRLTPTMPDRSLIVRPEGDLRILAGADCVFYVLIPCWIRVSLGDAAPVTLLETPTLQLSNSWFGEPTSGELCYAMRTTARRNLADVSLRPHRAVCPVHIRNLAPEPVTVSRLCLRVAGLTIYRGADRLWTNEIGLRHLGGDEPGEMSFGVGAPDAAGGHEVVCEPRQPRQEWISALRGIKSFIK